MNQVATSTVALTAYNALATHARGARSFDEIADMISAWAARSRVVVTESQMREAVAELVRRGYLHKPFPGANLLDVRDPVRRLVVERDRSDEGQDNPGWRGWRVHARPIAAPKTVLLDEVTR